MRSALSAERAGARGRRRAAAAIIAWALTVGPAHGINPVAAQESATAVDPLAARVDAYVEKSRVIVMTDIANEPDDQMSMVRFLNIKTKEQP